jgi:hypothetical protein
VKRDPAPAASNTPTPGTTATSGNTATTGIVEFTPAFTVTSCLVAVPCDLRFCDPHGDLRDEPTGNVSFSQQI